jgi:hypothetical protein
LTKAIRNSLYFAAPEFGQELRHAASAGLTFADSRNGDTPLRAGFDKESALFIGAVMAL